MRSRHLLMSACLSIGMLFGHSPAGADCTTTSQLRTCLTPSTVGYQDWTYSFTSPAGRESTTACYTCPYTGNACEGFTDGPAQIVQFDIPAGIVYARVYTYDNHVQPVVLATSLDHYWIVGPAAADPIACTAQFDIGGYGSCRSSGMAAMTVGAQTVAATYQNDISIGPCNAAPPMSGAITSPVLAPVGQPFDVSLTARITSEPQYGSAYVYGRLSFRDLPPGYTVVSCKGFGVLATPAVRRSWGDLKSRYR